MKVNKRIGNNSTRVPLFVGSEIVSAVRTYFSVSEID